jgi:hypothetical protein
MKRCLFILGTILLLLTGTACSTTLSSSVTPTPTLAPGMGRVSGVLQVGTKEDRQPAQNIILYLAETIKDSTGTDSVAALDRIRSPRTVSDDKGHFVFSNVPPGTYGLVIDLITTSYLLRQPDADKPLLIQVSAGEETDLGTLLYDSLPLLSKPRAYPYP